MKTLLIILTILVAGYGLKTYHFSKNNINELKKVTFEHQWTTFQKLGFTLNDGISKADFIATFGSESDFEEDPWQGMYIAFGMEIDAEDYAPVTNKCWHFDMESINAPGDYVDILKNIGRITNHELKFENIKDHVDIDNQQAWVSFEMNGEAYKWDLKVDADWADPALFYHVQKLTTKYKTSGRFTYYLLGQDFILGYESESNFKKIRAQTDLALEWLDAENQL